MSGHDDVQHHPQFGPAQARAQREGPNLMTDEFVPLLFKQLTPSRKKRHDGDVFVMRLDEGYLCGRVVTTSAKIGPDYPGFNLLYFYSGFYEQIADIDPAALRPDDLLILPAITNNQGWLRGYFETVVNVPLSPSDVLPVHHFRHIATGEYVNEFAERVTTPLAPIAMQGLRSYLTIEDSIARALGKAPTID
jgi:hypothetical protein